VDVCCDNRPRPSIVRAESRSGCCATACPTGSRPPAVREPVELVRSAAWTLGVMPVLSGADELRQPPTGLRRADRR